MIFPNPFSSVTTPRLALAGVARGGVRVFDASGKLMRTLEIANGPSIVWDGTDNDGRQAQAGVYVIRLNRGGDKNRVRLVRLR